MKTPVPPWKHPWRNWKQTILIWCCSTAFRKLLCRVAGAGKAVSGGKNQGYRCIELRSGPPDWFDRVQSGYACRQSDWNPFALPAPHRTWMAGKISCPAHGLCPAGTGQEEWNVWKSCFGKNCKSAWKNRRPNCAAVPYAKRPFFNSFCLRQSFIITIIGVVL